MADDGRYLYAVTRGLHPGDLADTSGLSGGRLDVVEHRGLCAVVSTVPLEEFGEEALRANLERLEWLEEVAQRHHTVVQRLSALGPTAPLRLATICLDDAGIRRRLDEWYVALQHVLDRVEGRMEWSVKVLQHPLPAPVAATAGSRDLSGVDYLRMKRSESESRTADEARAARSAEEIHARLAARSVASRRLPPQDPRLSGHEGTMVLNAAYLVDSGHSDTFAADVEELALAHAALEIDCGGPWPPYSFAMLEQP